MLAGAVSQVKMAGDCIGPEVKKMVDELQNGEVPISSPLKPLLRRTATLPPAHPDPPFVTVLEPAWVLPTCRFKHRASSDSQPR